MVRKCIKSRCLEDTISSMVFKLTSFRIFFSFLYKFRDHLSDDHVGRKQPDTSNLMGRHPWPRLRATAALQKVCQGSKSIQIRCQECWQMMAPRVGWGALLSQEVWEALMAPSFWFSSTTSCTRPVSSDHAPFTEISPFSASGSSPALLSDSLTFAWQEEQEYEHIIRLHLMSLIQTHSCELMYLVMAEFHFAATPTAPTSHLCWNDCKT